MTEADSSGSTGVAELRRRYLEVVRGALTHTLYADPDITFGVAPEVKEFTEAVQEAKQAGKIDLRQTRMEGRDWPKFAQTMVGMHRLENVQQCVESVIADEVPGDLIEAGVWRGGVTIFMRAVLAAYDVDDRTVFVADSFKGLPPPNTEAYPADSGDTHFNYKFLAVPREDVAQNFRLYGLLDDQVQFLEGWFSETLPTVADRTWSVVRIDGDMYESTMDALVHLYPRLSVGGYCIIDDYVYPRCRQAVEDFRAKHDIDEPIETIDWTGSFWRRRH